MFSKEIFWQRNEENVFGSVTLFGVTLILECQDVRE